MTLLLSIFVGVLVFLIEMHMSLWMAIVVALLVFLVEMDITHPAPHSLGDQTEGPLHAPR